jgi:hypothetical protein
MKKLFTFLVVLLSFFMGDNSQAILIAMDDISNTEFMEGDAAYAVNFRAGSSIEGSFTEVRVGDDVDNYESSEDILWGDGNATAFSIVHDPAGNLTVSIGGQSMIFQPTSGLDEIWIELSMFRPGGPLFEGSRVSLTGLALNDELIGMDMVISDEIDSEYLRISDIGDTEDYSLIGWITVDNGLVPLGSDEFNINIIGVNTGNHPPNLPVLEEVQKILSDTLRISSVPEGVELEWVSVVGAEYTVEYSTDLQEWSDSGVILLGEDDILSVVDPVDNNVPRKFYRVKTAISN